MKNRVIIIFALSLSLNTSCERFLDLEAPKDQMVTSSMFNNETHANTAMIGLLISMNNNGNTSYRLPLLAGGYADELTSVSGIHISFRYYSNAIEPNNGGSNELWNNFYNWIYQANAIIEGCESSLSIGEEFKKTLIGEALFLRSFCYFYLLNLYGNVPLLLKTDYAANSLAPNSSGERIYRQIEDDLRLSSEFLKAGYLDGTGKIVVSERLRPNRYAALALLARTYLYQGKWATAEEIADEIIEENSMYGLVSITQVFLRNNKEAIWQMEKVGNNIQGTYEGQYFQINNRPIPQDINGATLSESLIGSFDEDDLRLKNWVGTVIDIAGGFETVYYFPFKYKDRSTSSPLEFTTPFRLAEQYLIRSEARMEQDDIDGALTDLNVIRQRSGLPALTDLNKQELIDAILEEKKLEFFSEWGHRWLDIKRRGLSDAIMIEAVKAKGIEGTWSSYKNLWPFPNRDVLSNPNMTQNVGYN